jgi:hypothetical protein
LFRSGAKLEAMRCINVSSRAHRDHIRSCLGRSRMCEPI